MLSLEKHGQAILSHDHKAVGAKNLLPPETLEFSVRMFVNILITLLS